MWNTTNDMLVVTWEVLDEEFNFKASLIVLRALDYKRLRYSDDLNSHASQYKGRVDFVGDVRTGRLWFKLSNLTLNDTGRYAIKLDGVSRRPIRIRYFTDLIVSGQ